MRRSLLRPPDSRRSCIAHRALVRRRERTKAFNVLPIGYLVASDRTKFEREAARRLRLTEGDSDAGSSAHGSGKRHVVNWSIACWTRRWMSRVDWPRPLRPTVRALRGGQRHIADPDGDLARASKRIE